MTVQKCASKAREVLLLRIWALGCRVWGSGYRVLDPKPRTLKPQKPMPLLVNMLCGLGIAAASEP